MAVVVVLLMVRHYYSQTMHKGLFFRPSSALLISATDLKRSSLDEEKPFQQTSGINSK